MREIKFRAWTDNCWINKGMLYGIQETTYMDSFTFNSPELPLMQYTGLKDKNGKEIYEGDICRTRDSFRYDEEGFSELLICDNYNEFIYTVLYSEDHSGLNGYAQEDLEIIGNIHENPELL